MRSSPSAAVAIPASPAVKRLHSFGPLTEDEIAALREAARNQHRFAPQRELIVEGQPVRNASIILSGWACRVRHFPDGRRQIMGLLLAGDLMGVCRQREPLATTTITALTNVVMCPAPPTDGHEGLAEAYALSGALEEAYLFRHLARLGRLNAYERVADWLLEIRDRLLLTGLAAENRMPLPLTQEVLADTLGLTTVHINRTLQALRRERLIEWRGGVVELLDPAALTALLDYRPVLVTGR